MVLPFVITFYFMLSLLEDVGYLPRLAVLVDTGLHKLGLHGSAIVPTILGFGCNVPGALATRIMETEKQRFIAATLMAIAVPCMAQSAMTFGILGRYGLKWIVIVYCTLFLLYVIIGILLKKIEKGESQELLLEVPPYRKPDPLTILKKTWTKVYGCVIVSTYFPCIATFVVLLCELGIKDMLKATGLMIAVSLSVDTIMRLILICI